MIYDGIGVFCYRLGPTRYRWRKLSSGFELTCNVTKDLCGGLGLTCDDLRLLCDELRMICDVLTWAGRRLAVTRNEIRETCDRAGECRCKLELPGNELRGRCNKLMESSGSAKLDEVRSRTACNGSAEGCYKLRSTRDGSRERGDDLPPRRSPGRRRQSRKRPIRSHGNAAAVRAAGQQIKPPRCLEIQTKRLPRRRSP